MHSSGLRNRRLMRLMRSAPFVVHALRWALPPQTWAGLRVGCFFSGPTRDAATRGASSSEWMRSALASFDKVALILAWGHIMPTRVWMKSEGRDHYYQIPLLTNPVHTGPIPELDPWSVAADVDETLVRQLQAIATIAAAAEHLPEHEASSVTHSLAPSIMAVERRVPGLRFDPRPHYGRRPDPHIAKRSG